MAVRMPGLASVHLNQQGKDMHLKERPPRKRLSRKIVVWHLAPHTMNLKSCPPTVDMNKSRF
jgi:hypothetical protein